jgi:hypothetical protein
MHMPFSENHPSVFADGEVAETRPGSEGHTPVDVAQASGVVSCCTNELARAFAAAAFDEIGEIVGIHACELLASRKFEQRSADRGIIEQAVVIADDGKKMTNEFNRPPIATRSRSVPICDGRGLIDRHYAVVI